LNFGSCASKHSDIFLSIFDYGSTCYCVTVKPIFICPGIATIPITVYLAVTLSYLPYHIVIRLITLVFIQQLLISEDWNFSYHSNIIGLRHLFVGGAYAELQVLLMLV